ncbi:hypothetical protein IT409_00605 [Candidatus Falkowbacteria bacterium]|nr:hypothetical protein [Candidatus Falkowbacteria bacterium]
MSHQGVEPLMLDVSQAHEFKLACRRAGLTNADIKRMCEGDALKRLISVIRGESEVVVKSVKKVADLDSFTGTIDYSFSLEQMVDVGEYDWRHPALNAGNFPISGSGIQTVVFELISFEHPISTEDAKKEVTARGLKLGRIEHLLLFGAKYPQQQTKSDIVALGSEYEVEGEVCCAMLSHSSEERDLSVVCCLRYLFNSGTRILAIH